MPYQMKPLACGPQRIKSMSERLIISHYENNYGNMQAIRWANADALFATHYGSA